MGKEVGVVEGAAAVVLCVCQLTIWYPTVGDFFCTSQSSVSRSYEEAHSSARPEYAAALLVKAIRTPDKKSDRDKSKKKHQYRRSLFYIVRNILLKIN
ncbi:hypothetical protein V1478_002521 [Vespula squamosa]|uniref:Secreted protein n=1 Tax=Vespula squamosa TaxID=30214 RepID=A0ABD2BST5_VESSQ